MDVSNNSSNIRKVGPLFVIEGGDLFISPFLSRPLLGYDKDKVLLGEQSFIDSIRSLASNWYEKFPDCCDTHNRLRNFNEFNKKDYDFIPDQIVNNVRFFAYAIEVFIDKEDWSGILTDYMDYLLESLGNPEIGGHIFRPALSGLIEGVKIEGKNFTDDQRLDLLQHLEPKSIVHESDDSSLETLYATFQKWIELMPGFGKFKGLKQQLTGKIPLNIFLVEHQTNRFTGLTRSKFRNREELLGFLTNMTNEIIRLSKEEFSAKDYDKSHLVLAAEEKLRISHEKFFGKKNSKSEINYLEAIEIWLSIIIEFYSSINLVAIEKYQETLEDKLIEVKNNQEDILSELDKLIIEFSTIVNSKLLNWIENNIKNESIKKLLEGVDSLKSTDKEQEIILEKVLSKIKSEENIDIRNDKLESKMNDTEISAKHKLKLSIPIFLFTRYESEIEISNKQKMPKSLKELKALLFE